MSFDPITKPIDYVLLANRKSPGIADVDGASSPRRWDERKGYAQSGARVVFRGIGLSHFTVTLRLYTAQHFADWHEWRELVQRPPVGQRARAQDIWHPILEDLGIVSVVVEDVTQLRQTADGEWSTVISFIEFRPPLPRLEPIDSSAETSQPLTAEELEIITLRTTVYQLQNQGQNLDLEYARQQNQTLVAE